VGGSQSIANPASVIAADGLYKRDVFRECLIFLPLLLPAATTVMLTFPILPRLVGFPDPFAVATVNGEQTKTTSVIKKTLNPYWNERFDLRVNEDSVLAVQIFDQKKFKKKDQGFLGVVNIRVGNVIDLDAGGDGTYPLMFPWQARCGWPCSMTC